MLIKLINYQLTTSNLKTKKNNSAFTLLELIVVLAGLGILAGLAFPNFLKYLEFAQIDEAKSLLNAAASECLQLKRNSSNSTSDVWMSDEPEVLKSRKSSTNGEKPLLPGKYEYKDNKKTCAEVQIHDDNIY
jgi:prepilin-type N-terminal cleavage/methylation domain-containing protein